MPRRADTLAFGKLDLAVDSSRHIALYVQLAGIFRRQAVTGQRQRPDAALLAVKQDDQRRHHHGLRMDQCFGRRIASADCLELSLVAKDQADREAGTTQARQRIANQHQGQGSHPARNRTEQYRSRGYAMRGKLDRQQVP